MEAQRNVTPAEQLLCFPYHCSQPTCDIKVGVAYGEEIDNYILTSANPTYQFTVGQGQSHSRKAFLLQLPAEYQSRVTF